MLEQGRADVLIDLGVQREYLAQTAPRRCRNADQILPNLRRLMALARWARLPVLSVVDARRPNQLDPELAGLGVGVSPAARKAACTLLRDHAVVESDNCLSVSLDVLCLQQQTIFTKYHRDPFSNPKLDRLLTEGPAGRFVIFGVPLETSLRILALGLMRRNRPVALIEDACGWFNPDEAAMVLRQLSVKGCTMLRTENYVASECARLRSRPRPRPRSVA